ncbi:MAG: GatB/YqeY domain-containing protein, partial [Bacteriovoracaceae bacterium]
MIDQISDDIKNAMKSKDKVRLNALRFVKKLLLENKTSAKPIAELDVIISYHKKLKDSLQNFPEDHPTYTSTLDEVKVLQEYLPQPLEEA